MFSKFKKEYSDARIVYPEDGFKRKKKRSKTQMEINPKFFLTAQRPAIN